MAKNDSAPSLMNTSIIKKFVMSITGLMLILFLLFHMSMNLVAVFSTEGYNMICEFLGANWYALAASLGLAAGFVIHIIVAIILTLQNQKARGSIRYAVNARPKEVEWASKNMFVLGVIVIGFLCLHLTQFWYKMQFAELMGLEEVSAGGVMVSPADGAALIQYFFGQPLYVVLYIVWLGALWFHLTHGFWSAFQTIGWDGKIWFSRLRCISNIVATIIAIGFALVPIFFLIKSLCCSGCCPA
jgi:succinate dehydrogenase / fumarate reductase, cytochrome b subunit